MSKIWCGLWPGLAGVKSISTQTRMDNEQMDKYGYLNVNTLHNNRLFLMEY